MNAKQRTTATNATANGMRARRVINKTVVRTSSAAHTAYIGISGFLLGLIAGPGKPKRAPRKAAPRKAAPRKARRSN